MATTQHNAMEAIDELIAASNPASEPILVSLAKGELSRESLYTFVTQYFHLMDALPRYVSTVHAQTDDAAIRRVLLNILVPLELKPPSVGELWLQTCSALGLSSDLVRHSQQITPTIACHSDYEYLCSSGSIQGIAALYSWMRRLPTICVIEQKALAEHYDLASGPGVEFFEVMRIQASSHARDLKSALTKLLERHPEAAPSAIHAADAAIIAVKGMYQGALSAR